MSMVDFSSDLRSARAEIEKLTAALAEIMKLADTAADAEAAKALNTIGHIADEALNQQKPTEKP